MSIKSKNYADAYWELMEIKKGIENANQTKSHLLKKFFQKIYRNDLKTVLKLRKKDIGY